MEQLTTRLVDRVTTLAARVMPRGIHELTPEEYLGRLNPYERARVEHFVGWSQSLRTALGGNVRVGVLGVENSQKEQAALYPRMPGSELKVLNSTPIFSGERGHAGDLLDSAVRAYFIREGLLFQIACSPFTQRGYHPDRKFALKTEHTYEVGVEGAYPLYVSLSGLHSAPLDEYIGRRRISASRFSVLMQDKE